MRASLVEREPLRLQAWESTDLYGRIQAGSRERGAKPYILHDGPPFANGDVHMGTALNKILKDFIIKSRTMAGFHAPYVPGWDCHGLPIEFKVVKASQGLSPLEIRKRSEEYARKHIDIQRKSFRRLGVFGEWSNPYLTLDPTYEADILRTFAILVEKNLIYRSKKPVLWSYGAQTALAEAEVEYVEKKSPAVFVKFPISRGKFAGETSLVIWTTTPWTLPANLGVAVHPRYRYLRGTFSRADGETEDLVIAKTLIEAFGNATGLRLDASKATEEFIGSEIEGSLASHPFLDRNSKVITGEFVTDDTGTGAVHIAPGHGMDDYIAGQKHDLGVLSPVDYLGNFTDEVGLDELVGKHVFESNDRIIEILKSTGHLLGTETFEHSYPHCWRSKTPIIFRAVEQFFVRIEDLREDALAEIDKVEWMPHWGRNRIYGTVESRPDWCISRQRTWGVPLPVFFAPDGTPLIDAELSRKVADLVEEHGSNIWFELSDEDFASRLGLPEGTTRSHDTLDVWIESGVSHIAVLDRRPDLYSPADLYIEGTDQHRGWFQSSLMMSVAAKGVAPYRCVVTNGFVVDKDSKRKLSKSEGGRSKPVHAEHFIEKYGADILRLWVSSVDYRDDVPFGEDLFAQTADIYRRIRNTLRILIANLYDFDPAKDAVPDEELTLIDRWILERMNEVTEECLSGYDEFEFRRVFNALNQFCAADLSSLFVDITKDRLYCDAIDSRRRRSTQTAMAKIFDRLSRLLAPVLVYTADEAWEFAGHEDSIHLELFPSIDMAFEGDAATAAVNALLQVRAVIQQAIEKARQEKAIGGNLEAAVTLDLEENAAFSLLLQSPEILEEFFILSDLTINPGAAATAARVKRTSYSKCSRCWKHESSVGRISHHPILCARCAAVIDSLEAKSAAV